MITIKFKGNVNRSIDEMHLKEAYFLTTTLPLSPAFLSTYTDSFQRDNNTWIQIV